MLHATWPWTSPMTSFLAIPCHPLLTAAYLFYILGYSYIIKYSHNLLFTLTIQCLLLALNSKAFGGTERHRHCPYTSYSQHNTVHVLSFSERVQDTGNVPCCQPVEHSAWPQAPMSSSLSLMALWQSQLSLNCNMAAGLDPVYILTCRRCQLVQNHFTWLPQSSLV